MIGLFNPRRFRAWRVRRMRFVPLPRRMTLRQRECHLWWPGRFVPGYALTLPLVGTGVLCLLLFALATPGAGQASSNLRPVLDQASRSSASLGETQSTTIFLPLIRRPMINGWRAEYYDNADLQGNPVYTAEEKRVDYDWGTGSPRAGMPADDFSIRWTGNWEFEVGIYTFFVFADDGVRLWLDGNLMIDSWQAGRGSHQFTTVIESAGLHSLKLEYFERTGDAAISLGWRRTDIYPQWQGTYYNNLLVESPKAFSRTDTAIQFNWGEGCPAGLSNCNNFSISWQATPVLETGTHRIYIYANDGYQLYVGGVKVKEGGWTAGQTGGSQDVYYDTKASTTEYRNLRFNFHDASGAAEARLLIQKRGDPNWSAQYYSNPDLTGTPVKTRDEEAIFYDWGTGKPISELPSADSFSVRWTGSRSFHAGCYHFVIFADDGVRLWVDGELLIDQWHDGGTEYKSPYTYLTQGSHDFKIEYYEHTGDAEIRLWWE